MKLPTQSRSRTCRYNVGNILTIAMLAAGTVLLVMKDVIDLATLRLRQISISGEAQKSPMPRRSACARDELIQFPLTVLS